MRNINIIPAKALVVLTFFITFFLFIFKTSQTEAQNSKEIIYQSPVPGAQYVMPGSAIIIKIKDKVDKATLNSSLFVVTASRSGSHGGEVVLCEDGRTIIFKPNSEFLIGEEVTAKLKEGIRTVSGASVPGTAFSFNITKNTISQHSFSNISEFSDINPFGRSQSNFCAEPAHKSANTNDLPADFPPITISQSNNPSPGYLFISNFTAGTITYGNYLMILDNSGNPVYYKKMPSACLDYKRQPIGVITYWVNGKFYATDNSFRIIDSFQCRNGYYTDPHELIVPLNGHSFMIGLDYQIVDMSKIVAGGNPNANVTGIIIQELDNAKNVVFQWRSWDHFQITDATADIDLTAAYLDPFHTNAIEMDTDGNLMISSRHMDEITKISTLDGHIMWRLGGKNNQFVFTNDNTGFSHQHAIRRIPNGNITLFDNGNLHIPPFSRSIEYQIDEQNKTATLVWQYQNSPAIFGFAMGYSQKLPNQNTLIGWGTSSTSVTEVTPGGTIAMELLLPQDNTFSYRAFRFSLIILKSPNGGEQFKNNTEYNIEWLSSGVDLIDIDFSSDKGHTWINITNSYSAGSGQYTWTTPDITSDSCLIRVKDASNPEIPDITTSRSVFTITSNPLPVELTSFNCMVLGKSVLLTWRTATEISNYGFEIERASADIKTDWIKIGFRKGNGTSNRPSEYTITDNGALSGNIYYYRLKQIDNNGKYTYSKELRVNAEFTSEDFSLSQNYPNPFNPSTKIGFSIPQQSRVKIEISNSIGQAVSELVNANYSAGRHEINVNAAQMTSGIYFYSICAQPSDGGKPFHSYKKMIVLR